MSNKAGLAVILTNIITAPTKAFEDIKQSGSAWFPLVLIVVLSAVVNFMYFQAIDFNWFVEQTAMADTAGASPAEKEAMTSQLQSMGKGMFMGIGIGGAIIGIPIIYAITAVLFLIISNIRDDKLTYGDCFTLVSWASVVKIASLLIAIINILLSSDGQIAQHDITGLNLNLLIFHADVTNPWYGFLSQFDLIGLWAAVVLGFGYRVYTNASITASMIFGFLPTAIYFGISALLI